MTALDVLAPPAPATGTPRPSAPDPVLTREPTDLVHVLVAGAPDAPTAHVRWALTQIWRRAGKPLHVATRLDGGAPSYAAERWAIQHSDHGIRLRWAEPGQRVDVLLVCEPSAALRGALPLARRAGIDVVHAGAVEEWWR